MDTIIYVAYFVVNASQLKDWATKEFQDILGDGKFFCHHVTIAFRPESLPEGFELGKKSELTFTKVYYNDKAICLGGILGQDEGRHLTVWTAEGVPPVYSNDLIKGEGHVTTLDTPLTIQVVEGIFTPSGEVLA